MKNQNSDNSWAKIVFLLFAVAYGLMSNDDYETAQRIHVSYHVK